MKNLEKRASLFAKILRSLSPKRSLVPRSRKLAFEPLENRELLTATPSLSLIDLRTNAALAHSDTIALTSFYADASGAATNPSYGEVVYRRVELTNIGDDPLAIDAIALSSGSRVEISGSCATSLAPNDSAILTLKWRALAAESSTLTIQTDDPVQATYQLNLTGAVLANTYIAPQLSALTLQCDTGANANDLVTCNPTVTGAISGDLYGGRLDVEFDLDNDAQVDAITPIYVDNSVFAFDPSEISAAFVAPDSGTRAVSLRYRPAIYDAYGDLVERGAWQTLSYTLEPAPSGTITVSNLALAANYDGDWTQTNVAKLSGTISGANDRFVQISINNDVYTYPTSESSFCVPIPDAFSYGVATTIRARGGQFDSTTQRVLYGAWSTISVTPTLVGVASLALETDDGDYDDDNISSDLTLVGALDAGIGANFAEVEFSCGNVVLGSTYADENGEFSFKPTNLPINDGVASGTIVARAVYRPANGAPIYGASRSIAVVYATPYSAESYNLAVALDSPKENAPNSTSAPSIVLSGEFNADSTSTLNTAGSFRRARRGRLRNTRTVDSTKNSTSTRKRKRSCTTRPAPSPRSIIFRPLPRISTSKRVPSFTTNSFRATFRRAPGRPTRLRSISRPPTFRRSRPSRSPRPPTRSGLRRPIRRFRVKSRRTDACRALRSTSTRARRLSARRRRTSAARFSTNCPV